MKQLSTYKFLWDFFIGNSLKKIFVINFGRTLYSFCEATNNPILDVCHGFQSQGWIPCLHASLPVCNRFLRFTSAVTPADLLVASMTAEVFHSCSCKQALAGLKSRSNIILPHSMLNKTDALMFALCQLV